MSRMLFAALFLAACGSDVSVDGEIGGRSFDLLTAYAWIDATQPNISDAGQVTFVERREKNLHVILSGARFDPKQDFRFMSPEQYFQKEVEEARNGVVGMRVSNSESLAAGAVLSTPSPESDGPELSANHAFGLVRIEPDDAYPASATLLASRLTYTFTVDTVERGSDGYVSGALVLAVERADSDPMEAAVGTIEVEFAARLIGERVAECNASGGDVCELYHIP